MGETPSGRAKRETREFIAAHAPWTKQGQNHWVSADNYDVTYDPVSKAGTLKNPDGSILWFIVNELDATDLAGLP